VLKSAPVMRALSLPGCACRGAFQFGVVARLAAAGERFDLIAGASSGSLCGAVAAAGLAARGPDFARELADAPIVSTRYLETDRSVFGMGRILREILRRNLPEEQLHDTAAELLIATTHAAAYARRFVPARVLAAGAARLRRLGGGERGERDGRDGTEARREALVVHSNRERRDLHDIIMASCYIPVLHARLARLDGALHVDGALSDNTLLDALSARGATEITVVTPFAGGAVAQTMFAVEGPLRPRPGVRLRVLYPERPLSIGRFDLSRERLEEALIMPHEERILDALARGDAPG
jgi:predicted acylesterase/phospholipase RssA